MTRDLITDRYIDGHVQRRVDELRPGDRVDLQNDPIADNGEHPEFEFEFLEVAEIDCETPECTVVYFNNFTCGFPPDHWVDVDGEQVRE